MNPQTHTLSDEFILPTNKAMGATRLLDTAGRSRCRWIASELTIYTADSPCIYFVGNSLGPLSKRSETLLKEELGVWGAM